MPTVWMSTSSNAKRYVRCFCSLYPSRVILILGSMFVLLYHLGFLVFFREPIYGMMYLKTLLFCVSGLISRLERSSAVQRLSWLN